VGCSASARASARDSARAPPCARQKANSRDCGARAVSGGAQERLAQRSRRPKRWRLGATHPEAQVAAELAQRAFVQEVDAAQDGVVTRAAGRGRLDAAAAGLVVVAASLLLVAGRLGLRVQRALAVATQRLQLLLVLRAQRRASA